MSENTVPSSSSSSVEDLAESPSSCTVNNNLRRRHKQPNVGNENVTSSSYSRGSASSLIDPSGSSGSEKTNNSAPLYNNIITKTSKSSSSKKSPLLLLLCSSGICISYLCFGMQQERLFSKSSSNSKIIQRAGNTTTFMLVLSCMTNVIVAYGWIRLERLLVHKQKKKKKSKTAGNDGKSEKFCNINNSTKDCDEGDGGDLLECNHETSLNHALLFTSAFCFFSAMTLSNESLSHVSYPTAVLAKSSKLIPTMIIGFIYEKKSFLIQEWMSAFLITCGIIIFNLSRIKNNNNDSGSNHIETEKEEEEDSTYGLLLLVLSLGFDGLLSTCQGGLKRKETSYRCPTALETMLWINAYAIVLLLPLSIYSGQFSNGIYLVMNHTNGGSTPTGTVTSTYHDEEEDSISSIRNTIALLNLTAAIGQIFIFFTIQLFSPLMCTTITTTRKFLTILLSVWKFGHKFTFQQWSSIFMVFGGLYLGIVSKFVGSDGITKSISSSIDTKNSSNSGSISVIARKEKIK